jgi:glyoxylase-like metal-dependent hydrolase (beta-lactamase superfamily II)
LAGSTAPWAGGRVTASARCILAPNASPWTLDGTNTWLLMAPGHRGAAVVDPGPLGDGHLEAILAAAQEHAVRIDLVLLTHGHNDHSEGARELGELLGVNVRALDPAHRLGAEGLAAGDTVRVDGWAIDVVGSPGHTSDSVAFHLPHDASLLTGDTLLGRGTALVAYPDGDLGDYLESLARIREVTPVARLLPGHGPVLDAPMEAIDAYLAHRHARLAEVREVMAAGVTDARAIVEVVYADVAREIWPAAEMTVRAQLAYVEAQSRQQSDPRG